MFKLYLNTIKCHQQTTSARLLTYEKNIGLGGEIEEDHASEEVTSFSKVKWRAILITSQLSLSLSLLSVEHRTPAFRTINRRHSFQNLCWNPEKSTGVKYRVDVFMMCGCMGN